MMHSPDTFLNILLNLIFLIAVRSTHNAFAIDRSIAIDVMSTSGLNDVYLPPLHIKLGLYKNFVKAMNLHGEGFKYLKELSGAEKSDAKLKAGIFVSPTIRKLMVDDGFQERLNTLELAAWEGFKLVVNNFLGNYRHNEYADMVDNMLKAYENLGSRMSLKMHFLHSHPDFFLPNLGAVSKGKDSIRIYL